MISKSEERLRIAKEKAEEERRRREQLKEQRQKEMEEEEARRQAEEQKRLELEAELCRRRDQLYDYKFGDMTRLDNFMGLNIDDVTQLRIGVFGSVGSGKSCFINTCERTVREIDRGSAPDSTTGLEGTITLQDYLPEMFFHLVDTRGFFNYNSREIIEFQNILCGKIQPGDNIVRSTDGENKLQEMHLYPTFRQRMHGIIFVVKANDPRLTKGALKDYLKPFRDVLRRNGIAPVTVITHRDTLQTEEDLNDTFYETLAATGSSPSHTFFFWNYTEDNRTRNPEIERMVFKILLCALETAERAVKIMKQKDDEVPHEIRARGPLALKAYRKSISEGRTSINRVPIMLIGQDRSGKTSLAKSLKGERFNPEEDSTTSINVDPSYFKVSTEIWKPGENDREQNLGKAFSFEHHAARLTIQSLSEREGTPGEESPESTQIEHIFPELLSTSRKPYETMQGEDVYPVPAVPDLHNTPSHDSVPKSESSNILKVSTPISTSQDTSIGDPHPVNSVQAVPEEVATLIEDFLKGNSDVDRQEEIYSVLWDFGGQAVYYTTHPLFLTPRAIYLLVNDLSRDPLKKAKSVMKQGMFTKQQDCYPLKTNVDYLDYWMSSVAALVSHDERNPVDDKFDILPEKLPPVFLVCTHADKPYDGGDPRELAGMVFGHLHTKPYKGHLHDVFIVDNTRSGYELECPEVVRLRKEIRAVAKELPQMKEEVPIKWLIFEKAVHATKEGGSKWISFQDAKRIARDVCNVVDDEEFRTLLNFLHDQRILIHFDDTPELNKMVILDAQWLIDVLKAVITIRPFDNKEKKFEKLWLRLEKEGVLEEPLLEHVWGPLYHEENTCQSLIAIMEKFSLLCSWPPSDGSFGKQYLVPSMLMSHPPEDIIELVASAEIPSLFVKFVPGQVPPGLFPRLVLQFLQWCKQEHTSSEHPQLYHNFVRIYGSEEADCSVILLCHTSSIEVVVHKGNYGHEIAHCSKSVITSPVDSNHGTFARAVLRQLKLLLESMRREFCWLQNMKYEVSLLCPVCSHGGAVSYCRTHLTKGCKQEECLHFWLESELCSEKKMICCTRSAVAKRSRVLLKNFEAWFSPVRNQFIVDECDDGNLASVEDGEETLSADEVLNIRLTQERDGPSISPQLKGILQLEGACSDAPDFDCKSVDMLLNSGKTTANTEVSLPDNVEQSLLSASSDAKQVVLQLKENLRLDKDVLEQPDPETKKIVRSLAQKAKDLKRLDVFEHLRETAPAGTTGPLLPENLPVQNMPITKARELTIDLAGDDKWMELAEGLGLTPQEIRFLDKRTLNPMEAALSFIARQRHLSVGELYELLNEHGFPMLADRL